MPIVQTVTLPSTSHFHPVLWIQWIPCQRLRHFYPVCKVLSCPSSALLDDDTVEGLDCSSLPLGETCVVTCADGHTAAGDTETTLTCVSDPELQSMLLEGSTHSCKLAPCNLSTLMPPSTVSHDCPNSVFEESSTVLTGSSDGALVSDPTLPYPTCEALTCSIGDLLLNGSLSGPDCASWTMGESCAVTYVEGCQAANETSGTLTCVYSEVAGDVVLEVVGQKCMSVVCSLGNISATSLRCRSSGEFVPQMLGSDTLIQSGFGVNSTCGCASIGDTCPVFCAEGFQAVSNDTSILTCAYNSCDNTADWEGEVPLCLVVTCDVTASLRVDFSECFSFTCNETTHTSLLGNTTLGGTASFAQCCVSGRCVPCHGSSLDLLWRREQNVCVRLLDETCRSKEPGVCGSCGKNDVRNVVQTTPHRTHIRAFFSRCARSDARCNHTLGSRA